jgi:Tol biopolymer transport system component
MKPVTIIADTMSLSAGDRLGRFEVLGCLGVGGMGEVYRARDSQLQREVAIKVLPAAFSRDADRQRRFEQEARAAGSLNHPNIVAVHDVGVQNGAAWIVTELLEGETLRQRLDERPLTPRLAIDYAIQIAKGLAAAHERGFAHRDIKPANLFVTRDGRIKILDFGLAKLIRPESTDSASSGNPSAGNPSVGNATETVTIDGVQLAPVVGTATYMSPEQARGLRTDHRSDIFSFGAVLYEMVAGVPPFRRATTADTLSAILHDEPAEFSATAPIDAGLERIIRHCLEKEPSARFQSARDLVFDLETVSSLIGAGIAPARLRRRHAAWRSGMLAAVALLGAAVVAMLGYVAGRGLAPAPSTTTVYSVRRLTDFRGLEEFPSISPDRRSVAFTADVNGRRQIFVRLVASGPPLQITNDALDHQLPRWSPDASAIVYFAPAQRGDAQGTIWSIPALGGSPRRVMASLGGADVSRQGRVACFSLVDGRVQLSTSALDGADVRAVARFDAGYLRYPRWSPDGRWIAFQRGDGVRYDIFVVPALGGQPSEPRQITHDRNFMSGLAWLPDSSGIVYSSSRAATVPYLPPLGLWEVRLDGSAPRALTPPEVSYEQPDVHDTGLVAVAQTRMRFDVWKFPVGRDAAANVENGVAVTRQTGQVMTPTAAADGDRIAFLSDSGGHSNLWVLSTRTGSLRQVTFEHDSAAAVGAPVWSPAGESIAFVSSKGLTGFDFGVWLVDADGSNLRNVAKPGLGMAWSPDGRSIYYADTFTGAVKKVSVSGGTPVTVRSERARNVIGLFDGTLYYMVERPLVDGRPEFEIRAATPEDGPSRLLSRIPASRVASWQIVNPSLSPDGRWLALPLTDGFTTNIWTVSTANGEWRQVTDFGDRAIFIARKVSWSPDGAYILAAIGEGDADIVLLDGLINRR